MDAIISPFGGDYYQRVKLLTAKDGKPIQLDDTVWGEDGVRWRIVGIGERYVWGNQPAKGGQKRLKPEWLTHEEPDSWQAVRGDMEAAIALMEHGEVTGKQVAEQMRDLVRRCEALAVQR